MYARLLQHPERQSFFLLGPRGTGKTAWLRTALPNAITFDLLDDEIYTRLLARPGALADQIPASHRGWVVIDEVQRLPALLNEVHRLIEGRWHEAGVEIVPVAQALPELHRWLAG